MKNLKLSISLLVSSALFGAQLTSASPQAAGRTVLPDTVQVVEAVQGQPVSSETQPDRERSPDLDRVSALPPVSFAELRRLKALARTGDAMVDGVQQLDTTSSLVGLLRNQTGIAQSSLPNNAVPPDTILARSGTRVLEAVNRGVQLRSLSGSQISIKDLNDFFAASTTDGLLFDPKVYYDQIGGNERFYVVALQQNSFPRLSRIWLAVSRSADPANLDPASWCRYSFDGRRDIGTTAESWADYPGLGGGRDALVITTNQFTFGGSFTYSIVHTIHKEPLANNAFTCPALTITSFQPASTQGDFNTFTLQPVHHYAPPRSRAETVNPVYLINTFWFGGTDVYRVWQVSNVASGSPVLASRDSEVGGQVYDLAPDSPQNGSTSPRVDTGDLRIYSASATSLDEIWAAHTVSCNIGGGENESCIRVFSMFVGGFPLQAGPGYFITFGGGAGDFFSYPAIAVNGSSQVGIGYQFAGQTDYLGAGWAFRAASSTLIGATGTYATGNCVLPQSPGRIVARAGDYSGAQTTPDALDTFWLAGEHAQQVGSACHWATRIAELSP